MRATHANDGTNVSSGSFLTCSECMRAGGISLKKRNTIKAEAKLVWIRNNLIKRLFGRSHRCLRITFNYGVRCSSGIPVGALGGRKKTSDTFADYFDQSDWTVEDTSSFFSLLVWLSFNLSRLLN